MALLGLNPDGSIASDCPICKTALTEPVFATSHFVLDCADPFYPYSDAGMHWDCYANWKYQKQFASRSYEATRLDTLRNEFWPILTEADAFFVSANSDPEVFEADVETRITGSGFRVPIREWTHWINGGWRSKCLHNLERLALEAIGESLRQTIPTSESLLELARHRQRKTSS